MEYDSNRRTSKYFSRRTVNLTAQNNELNYSFFGSFCFFVLLSLFILGIAVLLNNDLPEPISVQNATTDGQKFIAERAYNNLLELVNIGPKIVGTYENEVLAVKYLKKEIEKIIQESNNNFSKFSYDHQIVSGCFKLQGSIRLSCYENVQNIIVKLQPIQNVTETILINCHFDSVMTSPGASDDNLHCALMLEILRVFSRIDYSLKKNVLFLFNGAEEDGLLASHGFITQHSWAKDITCFINLEACGAGGREILFQSGPNAVILPKIYSDSVPYPHGNVIGEELFQSGVLPSDTDFRIFRDYGKLKGLDFAHYKNGYVYHTREDNINHISKNVLQHSGSNILSLLNSLIAYDNLKNVMNQSNSQAIYFDIFGKFMICYSTEWAFIINVTVIIFSMCMSMYCLVEIFRGMELKIIYQHVIRQFFVIIWGIIFISLILYFLASLLKWRDLIMLWYSHKFFPVLYYGFPAFCTMILVIKMNQQNVLSPLNEAKLLIIIHQMINTFILLIGVILKMRSVYIFSINLLCISFSQFLISRIRFKNEELNWMIFTICNSVSSVYTTYIGIQCFTLIIPMMGRIGMEVDSEMIIWIICQLFVFMIFSYFTPLVALVKDYRKITIFVGSCYVMYVLFVLFGSYLFPFGDTTPERFIVTHVYNKMISPGKEIKIENSGYLVVLLDMRAHLSLKKIFPNEALMSLDKVYSTEQFYAFPSMIFLSSQNHNQWIEAEKPLIPREKNLNFHAEKVNFNKTFYFNLTGAVFSDIFIIPEDNADLIEWSFHPEVNLKYYGWFNKTVFYIRRSKALKLESIWSFWLKFNISNLDEQKSHVMKFIWNEYYRLNNTSHYTTNFEAFLNKFPSWTRIISYVSEHEEYLF